MIPVSPTIILAAVLAFVLALGGASWRAYDLGATHQEEKDKLASAEALRIETDKNAELSAKLSNNVHNQEVKDDLNSKAIDSLSTQLRRAVRLRDPNGCGAAPGRPTGPASGRQADGAETDGLLSAQLSGLLQRLTREADDINNAYASCRDERWGLQQELNARGTTR